MCCPSSTNCTTMGRFERLIKGTTFLFSLPTFTKPNITWQWEGGGGGAGSRGLWLIDRVRYA